MTDDIAAAIGKLPEWLQKELPEPSEPARISYDRNAVAYVLTDTDGTSRIFDNLEAAYDADREAADIVISDDVPESDEYGFIFIPTNDGHNSSRLLFSHSDDDRVRTLVQEYEGFLDVAADHRSDPESFSKAYGFVSSHPAFWTKELTRESDGDTKTFDWATYNFNIPHFEIAFHRGGSHSWFVESGAHVPPDYTEHFHDLRLDVDGKTPEECVFKLAELLDKFFNDDGTEKENVEYEKSPLEIRLEEAMKEYEGEVSSSENENEHHE